MTLGRALNAVGVALMVVAPPLSLQHPWGDLRATTQPNGTVLAGANVPAEVREVFEAKCSDCHSEETKRPEYSQVAPVSWLVERDLFEGRNHLNLSRWQEYSRESQIDVLTKIGSEARRWGDARAPIPAATSEGPALQSGSSSFFMNG
jgi:hypothetical protein